MTLSDALWDSILILLVLNIEIGCLGNHTCISQYFDKLENKDPKKCKNKDPAIILLFAGQSS